MKSQRVIQFCLILNRRANAFMVGSNRILINTIALLSLILIYNVPCQSKDISKKDSLIVKIPSDSIFVLKADKSYSTYNVPLQFSSFIQVKVHGLTQLQLLAAHKKKNIILFLDGIPMKGIITVGGDKKSEVLFFVLHRDSASMLQWNLLRKIIVEQKKNELSVSVGLEGEQPYPSKIIMAAELSKASDYFLALLAGTFFIIVFTFLVKRSNVLIEGKDTISGKYSLTKILLALWIVLILFCLIFILSATNSLPHLPNTILIMLSFSAITLFFTNIYHSLHPKIKQTPQTIEAMSKGFIVDMLTGNKGLNLFKIQLLFFNLFIMVHIIIAVISEMLLPSFEPMFIVLIGLSHLLYLCSLPFDK